MLAPVHSTVQVICFSVGMAIDLLLSILSKDIAGGGIQIGKTTEERRLFRAREC